MRTSFEPDTIMMMIARAQLALMQIAALKRVIDAYLLEFGVTTHSVFIGLTTGIVRCLHGSHYALQANSNLAGS